MENEGMTVGADNTNDIRGKHSLMRRHLQYTDQCCFKKRLLKNIYDGFIFVQIYIYICVHTYTHIYILFLSWISSDFNSPVCRWLMGSHHL